MAKWEICADFTHQVGNDPAIMRTQHAQMQGLETEREPHTRVLKQSNNFRQFVNNVDIDQEITGRSFETIGFQPTKEPLRLRGSV